MVGLQRQPLERVLEALALAAQHAQPVRARKVAARAAVRAGAARRAAVGARLVLLDAALLQLGLGHEALLAARHLGQVRLDAAQQVLDLGADLVRERLLRGKQRGLGDELKVLAGALEQAGARGGGERYAGDLDDLAGAREVAHARVEDLDGRVEALRAVAQGVDAARKVEGHVVVHCVVVSRTAWWYLELRGGISNCGVGRHHHQRRAVHREIEKCDNRKVEKAIVIPRLPQSDCQSRAPFRAYSSFSAGPTLPEPNCTIHRRLSPSRIPISTPPRLNPPRHAVSHQPPAVHQPAMSFLENLFGKKFNTPISSWSWSAPRGHSSRPPVLLRLAGEAR